jgi:hypothetical protein
MRRVGPKQKRMIQSCGPLDCAIYWRPETYSLRTWRHIYIYIQIPILVGNKVVLHWTWRRLWCTHKRQSKMISSTLDIYGRSISSLISQPPLSLFFLCVSDTHTRACLSNSTSALPRSLVKSQKIILSDPILFILF